jgi:hypothetical protein
MNYIKQLQQKVAHQEKQMSDAKELINALMKYLASPKFQGHENNYINAQEAYNMLASVKNEIM